MSDTRAKILSVIEQMGTTEQERARKIGVTVRTIDNWHAGEGLKTVEKLVDAGVLSIPCVPSKEITALFETIGKRRKLAGFEAKYNGEVVGTYATRDEAQAELDRIAYELAQVAA